MSNNYDDWAAAANRRLEAIHAGAGSTLDSVLPNQLAHPEAFIEEKKAAIPLWISEHSADPDFANNPMTQQRSDALDSALKAAQDPSNNAPTLMGAPK